MHKVVSIDKGNVNTLRLDITLDCGQCFRWEKNGDAWHGVIFGKSVTARQQGSNIHFDVVCEEGEGVSEIEVMLDDYFDLTTDYPAIFNEFSELDVLRKAIDFAPGIHILKQQPWEALCSFIISQNNNIPRIKGIISRLCESFGVRLPDGSYSFPEPGVLSNLTPDDLAPLRSGFRAKYIIDAAKRVACGEIVLDGLYSAPLEEAGKALQTILGVGPKVSDCTLLYGLHRLECFPLDVWMKRVVKELLPCGLPKHMLPYAGIAQQYLFHYMRSTYGK